MTDNRTVDQIIAGILGPAPTERERELAERVTLLENYAFDLQEANDRLEPAVLNYHEHTENKISPHRITKDSNFRNLSNFARMFQIEKCWPGAAAPRSPRPDQDVEGHAVGRTLSHR